MTTLHVSLEFDTTGADPNPWWRPFYWTRCFKFDGGNTQRVLRIGVFGVQLCFSCSTYRV